MVATTFFPRTLAELVRHIVSAHEQSDTLFFNAKRERLGFLCEAAKHGESHPFAVPPPGRRPMAYGLASAKRSAFLTGSGACPFRAAEVYTLHIRGMLGRCTNNNNNTYTSRPHAP